MNRPAMGIRGSLQEGHVPLSVDFLNTVQVSCSRLGGREFWEDHRLIDDLNGVVHGGQLGHRGFGEVAAFACFPLVVLLDQHEPSEPQERGGVGEHADGRGERVAS